jgi:hypothetical protein
MVNVGFYKGGTEPWHFNLGGKIDVAGMSFPPRRQLT